MFLKIKVEPVKRTRQHLTYRRLKDVIPQKSGTSMKGLFQFYMKRNLQFLYLNKPSIE
jgi:hypothetical protein